MCTHMHFNFDDTPILETTIALPTIVLLNSNDSKMLDVKESPTPKKALPQNLRGEPGYGGGSGVCITSFL